MATTEESASPGEQYDVRQPAPLKSTTVSPGLISIPDALAFWRRRRKPATA